MLKLALIGKEIQHSLSPKIYSDFLGDQLTTYDLLDYPNENVIPEASVLLSLYNGISITSPYKKVFIDKVKLTPGAEALGAINCLGVIKGEIVGENTDYLAIVSIVSNWEKKMGPLSVIILGDGVMSKITEFALKNLGISFKTLSRRTVDEFSQISLSQFFKKNFSTNNQRIVINTCSRQFVFQGIIDRETIFWDYNYNFLPHSTTLPNKINHYCDGREMLELQARHALAFWSINPV